MDIGHSDEIVKCLSPYWGEVIAWAATTAGGLITATSVAVKFIMDGQVKVLEREVETLKSVTDSNSKVSTQIADHYKNLYEQLLKSITASPPKPSNRAFVIVAIAVAACLCGAAMGGFGTRLYYAGPVDNLSRDLFEEKAANAKLADRLNNLEAALPLQFVKENSNQVFKSVSDLKANVVSPAVLIDSDAARFRLESKTGRLSVLVTPSAQTPPNRKKIVAAGKPK